LALYTAIQSPSGDDQALRLAILSFVLGLAVCCWQSCWRAGRAAWWGVEWRPLEHNGCGNAEGRVVKRRDGFTLDANFEAPTPGVVALFGRSGCGKDH